MKVDSTDTRRVHNKVTYHGGDRKEETVWGDVRTVSIALAPQEVPDQLNDGSHGTRTLFRPERATIQWQRNTRWGFNSMSQGWKGDLGDGWHLITARIDGTNIKKNGETGKVQAAALYAHGEGWGIYANTAAPPPGWFAALLDEHDPAKVGSPLDDEPKG